MAARHPFNKGKQQETEQQQEQGGHRTIVAAVRTYLLIEIKWQGAEMFIAK
ncbi:Uncharacterised protein [Yersinia enterocolitica]|nr:Uncharacterised protein [Yersinia enterocolitica]